LTETSRLEGEARAQNLAAALAQKCDPEFLEAVLHMKSALDEFGGQVFIAAARDHFNDQGAVVPVSQPGRWTTYGYLFHYGDKPQIRRLQTDEEAEPPSRLGSRGRAARRP
jgi:hypothetical protein